MVALDRLGTRETETQTPTWLTSRWSVSSCRFLVQRRVIIRGGDLIIRRQPDTLAR